MRVMIVGGGGREHALAWRWRRDAPGDEVTVAPGNAGTADIATNIAVDVTDSASVAQLARDRDIELVVIGPDAAAAAGVADACHAAGIAVFGPTAYAARIESSKSFAKTLMQSAGIPTAHWVAGDAGDREELVAFARDCGGRCVVKADGLALGKGVTVCDDMDDAARALAACFDERRFGESGSRVVVEERLEGAEVSVLGIADGTRMRMLVPARDHKRANDGDAGPNTGGMGAVAPPDDVDSHGLALEALHCVLQPCLDSLRDAGTPFVGCLYAGLMLTESGLRVLEFNARFGDPEAQVLLPQLGESLPDLLTAAAHGSVTEGIASRDRGACVGVVAAAPGYPGSARTGDAISGLDDIDDDALCFHAGTRRDEQGTLRTSGGRVLCVVGRGSGLTVAREAAYANLQRVHFDGMWYRSDIGMAGASVLTRA